MAMKLMTRARSVEEAARQHEADAAKAAAIGEAPPLETLAKPLNWWQRRKEVKALAGRFENYPHLLAMKPKEGYLFRSDYFTVDGSVACVVAYFHDDAAHDNFGAFWGIQRIPAGLNENVTAVVFEQIRRMEDAWVDQYTSQSEKLDGLDASEQGTSGSISSKRKAAKASSDLGVTIAELQDGSSYLGVHNRLMLKAPTLAILEESLSQLERLYNDRMKTVKVAPYAGEQRRELSQLLQPNSKKRGKGFHFTSAELAGSYSLVTNGLNDPKGEYVGFMVGDVNNSAAIMEVNGYDHHVVIADSAQSDYLERQRVSNLWCSKLSQAAMLDNGNVVHLVLDGANLDLLGPKFERLTSRVDMNMGDVNLFEMFGDHDDELAIFATQMEKLKLMFRQLHGESDGAMNAIIDGALEKVATDFYVEQGMWRHNAKEQRHRLRLVGIPHDQLPRMQMFVAYLDTAHKTLMNAAKHDPDQLRALNVLKSIGNTMLSTNGDLFDNFTSSAIDGVRDAKRVVYEFSELMRRGTGVAMAQLVNIVGFAVGKLGPGDTVIVHGTEHIAEQVKSFLKMQFEAMHERGARVVYSYNSVEKMLADHEFNSFDAADYLVLGAMRERTVNEFQRLMQQQIPADLVGLVTQREAGRSYLRRGMTNTVFRLDLSLGVNPRREQQRRALTRAAAVAETQEQPEPPGVHEAHEPRQLGSKRSRGRQQNNTVKRQLRKQPTSKETMQR